MLPAKSTLRTRTTFRPGNKTYLVYHDERSLWSEYVIWALVDGAEIPAILRPLVEYPHHKNKRAIYPSDVPEGHGL